MIDMRFAYALFLCFLIQQNSFAQNSYASKQTDETLAQMARSVYKYAEYQQGKLFYKDHTENDARLNYNRVLGKIFYLDRMGKPVMLENPDALAMIAIAKDTFYYFDTNCVIKTTHFVNANLYEKQTILYEERNDATMRSNLDPVIITNGTGLPYSKEDFKTDNSLNKSSLFKIINDYYIADGSMKYFKASKKNLFDLFSDQREKIKEYLRQNEINFNVEADIVKALQYINSL